MYVFVCVGALGLHLCLCTTCMSNVHTGQQGASDPLELDLQPVVNHGVGSVIEPRVLWKKADALSHLSSLSLYF